MQQTTPRGRFGPPQVTGKQAVAFVGLLECVSELDPEAKVLGNNRLVFL